MTKLEFLHELLRSLSALPENERDKAYAFYSEIIDDSMEDGMSEEEAVGKLGSVDEIVERIVSEIPMTVLIKSRVEKRNKDLFTVVLLVLGFPVWFPVLISVLCVLLAAFIVFWIAALVLWIVFTACAAAAVSGFAGLATVPGFGAKLLFLGTGLIGAGCAVPLYMASLAVTKQFAVLTGRLWIQMKNSLIRKRRKTQ